MQIFKSGSWRSPTGLKIFSGGTWRNIVSGQAYINGAWRSVCSFTTTGGSSGGGSGGGAGLTLSLSTTSVSARGSGTSMTTGSVTLTPSGGVAPYHYTWSITSTDGAATYTIAAPAFATTAVSESGLISGDTGTCQIHCAVTDSSGLSATSGTVTATFFNTSA